MWTAQLFRVSDGSIGPQFDFTGLKWSISLNDNEKISLELRKSSLPRVDLRYWLDPWWAGVLICWKGIPIVAGPILQRPSESFDTVSLECQGIRSVLSHRFAIHEQTNWNDLAAQQVAYRNMSLAAIARAVVSLGQQKPGGALPIRFPIDEKLLKGNHERTYQSFNLSNITVDDILTKISEVTNGPDIMFRPSLIASNQLVFDMWHGIEENPRIPQTSNVVFDTTTQDHSITEVRIVATGSYQTHRVFAVGAGQDQGTLIRMAQDLNPSVRGYPFLETVHSVGSVEDPAVVANHARANLLQNSTNLLEISMKVSSEGAYPLGTYQVGDVVELITNGFVSIPSGRVFARILAMSGDDSTGLSLSLQVEE